MLEAGPCPVAPQDLSQSAPECFGLFRRVMNSLVSSPGLLQGCSPRRFVYVCPGFGWDRVNFLFSSWYSAVFWI